MNTKKSQNSEADRIRPKEIVVSGSVENSLSILTQLRDLVGRAERGQITGFAAAARTSDGKTAFYGSGIYCADKKIGEISVGELKKKFK